MSAVAPLSSAAALLRAQIIAQAEAGLMSILDATLTTPARPPAPSADEPAPAADTATEPAPPPTPAKAVEATAQQAVSRQGGLSPLLADLEQALNSPALPAPVRTAAAKVLALRTPLTAPPTPAQIKQAVSASGLFFEPHLAAGGAPAQPDMKAALLVLRQALQAAAPPPSPAAAAPVQEQAAPAQAPYAPTLPQAAAPEAPGPSPLPGRPASTAQSGAALPAMAPAPDAPSTVAAPSPTPPAIAAMETDPAPAAPLTVTPAAPSPIQAALPSAPQAAPLSAPPSPSPAPGAPAQPALAGPLPEGQTPPPLAEHGLPQPLLHSAAPLPAPQGAPPPEPEAPPVPSLQARPDAPARSTPASQPAPPPPFKGDIPHAQKVAAPSLPTDASAPATIAHLEKATAAALARGELFQLASLPDAPRTDAAQAPRAAWMFEIPFLTAQGAAIAQFQIEKDGGGGGAESASDGPVWKTRFSIDFEPLGPVHAQLVFQGGQTAVTLWAERDSTADQLRRDQADLAGALEGAEIAVYAGSPRAAPPAPGRFVDRSS